MSLIENAFKNNADFKVGYEVALMQGYLLKRIKFGMRVTPNNRDYMLELVRNSGSIYFIDEMNQFINVIGYINLN